MIKDKQGNKYTYKEFIAKWKQGIEGITPLQQVKGQVNGTRVLILGIILGMIACAFTIQKLWWVEIILGASLFNTYISLIGLKQKKKVLEQFASFSVDTIERGVEENGL